VQGESGLFSERKGLKPVRSVVQKTAIDDALRNGLWNAFHLCLWERLKFESYQHYFNKSNLWLLFQRYWLWYFKKPLDNLPGNFDSAQEVVRKYFFGCPWFEVYDFVEFTAQSAPEELSEAFVDFCNVVLEREMSAYRLVDKRIVEITAEEEISSIESALQNTTKLAGAHAHLESALAHLSDRKNPDYRNSIKEAISAVESLAQVLTGDPKATLGAALKALERKSTMHPALKSGLSSLYGYTSDSQGIRHDLSPR
jgi:hypothetical protein